MMLQLINGALKMLYIAYQNAANVATVYNTKLMLLNADAATRHIPIKPINHASKMANITSVLERQTNQSAAGRYGFSCAQKNDAANADIAKYLNRTAKLNGNYYVDLGKNIQNQLAGLVKRLNLWLNKTEPLAVALDAHDAKLVERIQDATEKWHNKCDAKIAQHQSALVGLDVNSRGYAQRMKWLTLWQTRRQSIGKMATYLTTNTRITEYRTRQLGKITTKIDSILAKIDTVIRGTNQSINFDGVDGGMVVMDTVSTTRLN